MSTVSTRALIWGNHKMSMQFLNQFLNIIRRYCVIICVGHFWTPNLCPIYFQSLLYSHTYVWTCSILCLPVHSVLNVDLLYIEVWTIIIWLFISWVTRIDDEGFDLVKAKYMTGAVVKMAVMAIIEEDLWIENVWSKD